MYLSKEMLTGNEKAKFILIEDNAESSGRRLFSALIKSFCKEGGNLLIVCSVGPRDELYSDLNLPPDQIKFLDVFSDPLNWKETNEQGCDLFSIETIRKISGGKRIICLDNLSIMCLHKGVHEVYRCLQKLLQTDKDFQLLALTHTDVHSAVECTMLRNISSTILNLTSRLEDNILLCTENYSHCKLAQNYFEYNVDDEFNLTIRNLPVKQTNKSVTKQPDPTAHLTFNLKLKDDEKEVRNQLQLPYMKTQEIEVTAQNFLEEDYYDEDDPDDDLDV